MAYRELYAFLPGLSSEIGHIFHYHLSVQKAMNLIGWKYTAFVPKETLISPLPLDWLPRLAKDRWDGPKGVVRRLKVLFANIVPFRRIFQSIEKKDTAVVFLEHFELQHLASLFFALLFVKKPQFHFWILHRFFFGKRHFKTMIYRFFHWYLEKKFDSAQIKYLTDSELLAREQEKVFCRPISIVPIPHTQEIKGKKSADSSFFLWWPGGSIREDKGLSKIRYLVELLKTRPEMQLVVAETAKSFFTSWEQVLFIPTQLSQEEYLGWMQRVDLILLPYSSSDYSHRTSGIFVEAISAGVIVAVSKDTWMAYELEKFGLHQLVFHWEEENILEKLYQLRREREILEKLQSMRSQYLSFHSEKGFSSALQKLSK